MKITNIGDVAVIVHHRDKFQIMSGAHLVVIMVMRRSYFYSTCKRNMVDYFSYLIIKL